MKHLLGALVLVGFLSGNSSIAASEIYFYKQSESLNRALQDSSNSESFAFEKSTTDHILVTRVNSHTFAVSFNNQYAGEIDIATGKSLKHTSNLKFGTAIGSLAYLVYALVDLNVLGSSVDLWKHSIAGNASFLSALAFAFWGEYDLRISSEIKKLENILNTSDEQAVATILRPVEFERLKHHLEDALRN